MQTIRNTVFAPFGTLTATIGIMAMVLVGIARRGIATLAVNNDNTFTAVIGNKGQYPVGYDPTKKRYVTYAAMDDKGNILVIADKHIGMDLWPVMEQNLAEFLAGKKKGGNMADLICYGQDVETIATIAHYNDDGTVEKRFHLPTAYTNYRSTPDGKVLVATNGNTILFTNDAESGAWNELATLENPIVSLDRVRIVKGANGTMTVIANHENGWTRVEFKSDNDGQLKLVKAKNNVATVGVAGMIFTNASGTMAVKFQKGEDGRIDATIIEPTEMTLETRAFLGLAQYPDDSEYSRQPVGASPAA